MPRARPKRPVAAPPAAKWVITGELGKELGNGRAARPLRAARKGSDLLAGCDHGLGRGGLDFGIEAGEMSSAAAVVVVPATAGGGESHQAGELPPSLRYLLHVDFSVMLDG